MKSSPTLRIFLAAASAATSSAFDFDGGNDVAQTAGTVAPVTTDTLTPPSGSNGFGTPSQFTNPSTGESTETGQGWPSGDSFGVGGLGWAGHAGGWVPGDQGQMGWPSNTGEDQGWGTLGVDCSGSNQGGWGEQEWSDPGGDQGWGTLGVDCSGSNTGGEPEQEPSTPRTDSSAAVSASSTASSGVEPQGPTAEASLTSSFSGDQGTSSKETTQDQGATEAPETETPSSTPTTTGSTVGADAQPTPNLRSSTTTETSANQEQFQGQEQLQQGEKTSGGDVVQSMSVWGAPIVASTGTNITSTKPTFGKITSKSGECVVAEPTEYISEEYLDWVWQNRIGPNADTSDKANWNVMANKNFLMDKFVHNKGSINYCVRWDSKTKLPKNVASLFQGILERHYNKWNKWLEGYNCWPFTELKVNMVGWAAKDKTQFQWTDNSLGPFYEGSVDSDGVPQCPDECYRFYDNVNNQWSDTSACPGEPFDVSFWLKEDIPYGFGYDWGQEVSLNDTLSNLYDENILFIGHEIGHGFGLPDFYGLETKPSKDFPNSIMMAYSSTTITPSDGWMLRRILDHVRDRYKF
ncbi:hypothetical protein P3T76_011708 [Phytophthora citrophthora]|uniref:Neutral zinc metallopeptidase, Zn-binding site n=1 Tax=Phytophthora citrophthora TaxID=4793 RepID=A0AAD9G8U7_9STRA|nr:hypothetical protein P3T76_011708 [Phytophthora citrophthora]